MKHHYLFGFEVHELCRDCPGAYYSIEFYFPRNKPVLSMNGCGFCDPRNWELDQYSYLRY
jgi:hypothetical protein